MADPIPSPSKSQGVVKRRACDECRTRKLACSKELDGCSRCRREGLECVYSPQKPMGRPKKRRRPAEQPADATAESFGSSLPLSGLSQDPSFPPPGRTNPEFLSLNDLTPSFDFATSTFSDPMMIFDPLPSFDDESPPPSTDLLNSGHSNFGSLNSTEPKLDKENVHRIFQVIARHIFAQQVSFHDDANPQVIPAVEDRNPSSSQFKSHPNVTCPCLSSIYLTLDSLNNVSDDIPTAINTTRAAAKAAHEVLGCLVCSRPLVDFPLATPPMQSFQSMMLLSTLLASLSNAYFRLLELVDLATAEARSQNSMLRFSFRQLGGVWNELAASNGGECFLSIAINESDLDPDVWRLAMRAVLRYEIYGFNTEAPTTAPCGTDSSNGPSPEHFGLAQAVRDLEERSRLRHEKLDVLFAAGQLDWTSPIAKQMTACEGEKPQCMKIIECARVALDRLTIT